MKVCKNFTHERVLCKLVIIQVISNLFSICVSFMQINLLERVWPGYVGLDKCWKHFTRLEKMQGDNQIVLICSLICYYIFCNVLFSSLKFYFINCIVM